MTDSNTNWMWRQNSTTSKLNWELYLIVLDYDKFTDGAITTKIGSGNICTVIYKRKKEDIEEDTC